MTMVPVPATGLTRRGAAKANSRHGGLVRDARSALPESVP